MIRLASLAVLIKQGRWFQPLSMILTSRALIRQLTTHPITLTPAAADCAVIHKHTFQLAALSKADHGKPQPQARHISENLHFLSIETC